MSINAFKNQTTSESEMFQTDADWNVRDAYEDFVLLHRGVYADTFRARRAGKYFLLKTPKSGSTEYLNILKREYEISFGLDHPNIVSAFTFENIPPLGPCLVMKYVEGKSLDEYLSENPGTKSKKRILLQLLSAVGYLHRCGIVHNDLKPDNIIIGWGGEDNLKLIDFGLSDDEVHFLVKNLGCTPDYASPELLSGRGRVDARSDIYSLGKIIRLLFPRRYSLIWHKCTNQNPRRRYPSSESIVRAIKAGPAANVWVVILILLGLAASFILPPVLGGIEFVSEIEKAEHSFEKACKREGVPTDNVPHLSMSSYLTFGQDRAARADSLRNIMTLELGDRIVRRDAARSLDSLYTAYNDIISRDPYRAFGLRDAGYFYRECKAMGEMWLGRFVTDDNWQSFYSFAENQRRQYYTTLVQMARSLPDYGDLPEEEINFYDSLVKSGQPYRPYSK